MKKLLIGLIIGIGVALGITAFGAAVITPQFGGGTSTSTVFSQNSLILQGTSSYKGLATGSEGSVLSIVSGVPAYRATSTLGISGGSGTPGGSNTQLQYNNAGNFGGISALTWSGTLLQNTATTTLATTTISNLTLTAPLAITSGGTGTTTLQSLTLASLTVGSGLSVSGGDSVLIGTATQISLGVVPIANGGTNTSTAPTIQGQLLVYDGTAGYAPANLIAGTNITIATTTKGQITISSTGGGTPGGSNTQLQYNNSGAFGGISALTWSGTLLQNTATTTLATTTISNLTLSAPLPITSGGTGTTTLQSLTLASLTVGSGLSISGGDSVLIGTATQISLGVVPIANGGTATTASPSIIGQLLGATGSGSWGVTNLVAGSNVTLTTSTPGQITIATTGNQSITLSGDVTGSGTTAITTTYNGIVPIAKGGTNTSTAPSIQGELLAYDGTAAYAKTTLIAGTNITIATTTKGQITITAAGGSASASGTLGNIQFDGAGNTFNADALFNWDVTNTKFSVGTTATTSLITLKQGTTAAGGINFGDATANLYRSAAGVVKTDGSLSVGSTASLTATKLTVDTVASNGATVSLNGNFSSSANSTAVSLTSGISRNATAGTSIGTNVNDTMSPTSGTAVLNMLQAAATINQTSSATGISRGMLFNPTLTSAYDYRNLETTAAAYTYATNAPATLIGYNVLLNPFTYSSATSSGSFLQIPTTSTLSLAPAIPGTKLKISNSIGLNITTSAVTASTTNAYGLFVEAPTGATNNYAAWFNGPVVHSSSLNRGTVTLSSGTGTATTFSGAICVATDTTAANAVRVSLSGTTLTITGTGTDVINYLCN